MASGLGARRSLAHEECFALFCANSLLDPTWFLKGFPLRPSATSWIGATIYTDFFVRLALQHGTEAHVRLGASRYRTVARSRG